MKVTDAIARLQILFSKHGDVDVYADCPKCGCAFVCGVVVVGPETARLQDAGDPSAQDLGTPSTRV